MDPKAIGLVAALGSAASWAVGSILFKRIGEVMTPFAMTFSKGVISSVLLGIAVWATGFEAMEGSAAGWLLVSGLLGIAVGDTLFFAALQDLGPVALIVFLVLGQILTAMFGVLWLGEILPLQAWIGVGLTLGGIVSVLSSKIQGEKDKSATRMRGILLGSLFILAMSLSSIVAKKALVSVSTIQATFVRMAAGTLGMLVFGMATRQVGRWLEPFRDARMAAFFSASVCVVTFGGFWLSLVAIKYVAVAVATTLGATEPLFVLPLAVFFLKERVTRLEVAGTFLTVCGVVLLCRS